MPKMVKKGDLVITQGAGSVNKLVAMLADGGLGLGLVSEAEVGL